jgi:hypothetical protein
MLSRRHGTAVLLVELVAVFVVLPLVVGLKLAVLLWVVLAAAKAYGRSQRAEAPRSAPGPASGPAVSGGAAGPRYVARGREGVGFTLAGETLTMATADGRAFNWGVPAHPVHAPAYSIPVSAVTRIGRTTGTDRFTGMTGVVVHYQLWNGGQLVAANVPKLAWLAPGPEAQAGEAFIAALSAATGLACQPA